MDDISIGTRRACREPRHPSDPLAVSLRSAGTYRDTIDGVAIRSELFQIVNADVVVGEIVARLDAPMAFARAHGHAGYRIFPAFRGRGFAGEALRKLRELVRAPGRLLLFTCDAGNQASRKTLQNVGAILIERNASEAIYAAAATCDAAGLVYALDCQA